MSPYSDYHNWRWFWESSNFHLASEVGVVLGTPVLHVCCQKWKWSCGQLSVFSLIRLRVCPCCPMKYLCFFLTHTKCSLSILKFSYFRVFAPKIDTIDRIIWYGRLFQILLTTEEWTLVNFFRIMFQNTYTKWIYG